MASATSRMRMIKRLRTKLHSCQLEQMKEVWAEGFTADWLSTHVLPSGGIEMASQCGFWLRINVCEILEGDSQYKSLVHELLYDFYLIKNK
jgi:hypothetical protein